MLTSFPDLEKQGGNLIVEAILRGILLLLKSVNAHVSIQSMCSWTTAILTSAQL